MRYTCCAIARNSGAHKLKVLFSTNTGDSSNLLAALALVTQQIITEVTTILSSRTSLNHSLINDPRKTLFLQCLFFLSSFYQSKKRETGIQLRLPVMKSFLSSWTYTAINKRRDELIAQLQAAGVDIEAITRIVRRFGDKLSLQSAYQQCHSDIHRRTMLRDLSMGGCNSNLAVAGDGEELDDDDDEELENVNEIESEKVPLRPIPPPPPTHTLHIQICI